MAPRLSRQAAADQRRKALKRQKDGHVAKAKLLLPQLPGLEPLPDSDMDSCWILEEEWLKDIIWPSREGPAVSNPVLCAMCLPFMVDGAQLTGTTSGPWAEVVVPHLEAEVPTRDAVFRCLSPILQASCAELNSALVRLSTELEREADVEAQMKTYVGEAGRKVTRAIKSKANEVEVASARKEEQRAGDELAIASNMAKALQFISRLTTEAVRKTLDVNPSGFGQELHALYGIARYDKLQGVGASLLHIGAEQGLTDVMAQTVRSVSTTHTGRGSTGATSQEASLESCKQRQVSCRTAG